MDWMEMAIKKAGCESREAFCRKFDLPMTEEWTPEVSRAVHSWLVGVTYHRLGPGENLYQVAQRYEASVRGILTANACFKGRALQPGQVLAVPLDCPVIPWDSPFSSQVQALFLEGLQARCPRLEAWPLTRTGSGRNVWALRLGTGPRRVLMTAGYCSSEAITSLLLWRILEACCDGLRDDGYLSGTSCRRLFRDVSLYLVPLVNPDHPDEPNCTAPEADTTCLERLAQELQPDAWAAWRTDGTAGPEDIVVNVAPGLPLRAAYEEKLPVFVKLLQD